MKYLQLSIIICFFFLPCTLKAVDFVWDGGGAAGDWDDPLNWDQDSSFPNGNDDTATIDTGTENISTPTGTLTLGQLSLEGTYGGTLTLGGNLVLDDAGGETAIILVSSGTLDTSASDYSVTVDARIRLLFGGDMNCNDSTITVLSTAINAIEIGFSLGVSIFDIDNGTVDCSGGIDFLGNATVGEFNIGSSTVYLEGEWGVKNFVTTTGTVEMDGSANANLVVFGTGATHDFYNLVINKSSNAVVTVTTNDLEVDNALTITSGVLYMNGLNQTGVTTISNSGTFRLQGTETLAISTNDTNSGVTEFVGDGDAAADDITIGDEVTGFYNLLINSTDAADDYNLGANINVDGWLKISAGELDVTATDYQINLAGDWNNAATFTAQNGKVTLDGTAQQTIVGTNTFWDLHYTPVNPSTTLVSFDASSAVTFNNDFYIDSGVVTAGSVTLTFADSGEFAIGAGVSGACVSFDGTTITSDNPGTTHFSFTLNNLGDVHAKQTTKFDSLEHGNLGGVVFLEGSRMGSNTTGSDGLFNFAFVTFDNIENQPGVRGSQGLNLTRLAAGDADSFPDSLREIRFNIETGAQDLNEHNNVEADSLSPEMTLHVQTDNFGSLATNGTSGEADPSGIIHWYATATWVSLTEFRAEGLDAGDGIDVRWQTSAEVGNEGFNVYRCVERYGTYIKLNNDLIERAHQGVPLQDFSGQSYEFFDSYPKRGEIYYYKLEDIDDTGKRTLHGPISVDWDRDGLADDWEIANGLDHLDASDALLDSDGDGLTNLQEYQYGLDPRNADTDGDGIIDSEEDLNSWDGPIIPGINAGGSGLTIIGEDALGMTIELKVSDLIIEDVKHRYSGWLKTTKKGKKRFKRRRNLSEFKSLRFSDMSTEYSNEAGEPKLPIKRVLFNLPIHRTADIKILKEDWSEDIINLDRYVEPVPTLRDRPIRKKKYFKKILKQQQKRFKKRKHRRGDSSGRPYQSEDDDNNYTSKLIEVYGMDKEIYRSDVFNPTAHIAVDKKSVVGDQQALLMAVQPVKYNPVSGELKHLDRLRFRVDYIYDRDYLDKTTADWQEIYRERNHKKPNYLNYDQAVEIKIRKPAYSVEGNLNDKGLYKLTLDDLVNAGLDLGTPRRAPTGLRLYQGSKELSLKETEEGFLFYADSGINETLYNDRLTLYAVLDTGGHIGPPLRWDAVNQESDYDQTLTEFNQTIRYDQNNYYMYMEYSGSTLFMNAVSPYKEQTKTYYFNTPGMSDTGEVEFSTRLYGSYNYDPEHDQGVHLTLNSEEAPFASPQWPGQRFHVESHNLSSNLFSEVNSFKMQGYFPEGITRTRTRLDYVEVSYPRKLQAHNDRLLVEAELGSGVTEFVVSGFTDPSEISVLDVTDPTNVKEITGFTLGEDSITVNINRNTVIGVPRSPGFLRIDTDFGPNDPLWSRDDRNKTKILFTNVGSVRSIESAVLRDQSFVRGRTSAVDHLIVVDESLEETAENLVSHLEGQGQVVEMVSYQDLRKEYSHGEYTSAAIKEYVKERFLTAEFGESGKPKYLTIIGSGNINTKGNYNFASELPLIPTVLLRDEEVIKASAADWEFSLITGDAYPDIAVGRLDCGTPEELQIIIDKIISYESVGARLGVPVAQNPKALLVTDHDPSFDVYLFEKIMAETEKSFESPWMISKLYRTENEISQMTAGITSALNNENVNLLLYNGHGSFREWGLGNIYRHSNISGLNEGHFLPVIIESNCLSSDWFHLAYRSLGTQFVQARDKGAIAVIGNTSRTTAHSKKQVFISVTDNLLRRGLPELGRALLRAKVEATVLQGDRYQSIKTTHLLGLPSLELKR